MNSERKSLAAFTLAAALLVSSLPMLIAAPLAQAAASGASGTGGRARLSGVSKIVKPLANQTISFAATPISGTRGTTVTVTGGATSGNNMLTGPVTITLKDSSGAAVATITNTAPSGVLAGAVFTVPAIAALGQGTIVITDSAADVGSLPFTVTTPSITASPSSGPRGTLVSVSSPSGFTGTVTITSSLGGAQIMTSAMPSGSFMVTYTVPNSAPVGTTGSITATDSFSNSASAPFTVTAPSLVLAPTSGVTTTTVAVTGTGFATTTNVSGFFTPAVGTRVAVAGTTDVNGTFVTTFVVPNDAAVGPGSVVVTDTSNNVASATFTVTAASPTSTGTPATATSTVTPTASATVTPTATSTGTPPTATSTGTASATATSTAPTAPLPSNVQFVLTPRNGNACTVTSSANASAVAGQPVDFFVSGLLPGSSFTVAVSGTVAATGIANGSGVATGVFTPTAANLAVAPFSVVLTATSGSGTVGTVTLTISSCAAGVTLSTGTPIIGTFDTANGTGFTAGEFVNITVYTSTAVAPITTIRPQVAINGTFAGTFPVPATTGTYFVSEIGVTSGLAFTQTFTAVNPPTTVNGNLVLLPAGGSACTLITGTTAGSTANQIVSIVATGFTAGENVQFFVGTTIIATHVADANGNVVINPTLSATTLGAPSLTTSTTIGQGIPNASLIVSAVGLTSQKVASAALTTCATTITPSSPTAVGGTAQTVNGSGFGVSEVVSVTYHLSDVTAPITLGASAPNVTQVTAVTANTLGQFSAGLTTPITFGTYYVVATGLTTGLVATTTITSTPGALTIPAALPCGPFTISASSGFSPTEVVSLTLGAGVVLTTSVVNASGGFTASGIVPANTPLTGLAVGIQSVRADDGVYTVTVPITVPTAVLAASTNNVGFGNSIVVTGSGYLPTGMVSLTTEFATPGGTIVPNIGATTMVSVTPAGTFTSTYLVSPTISILTGGYQVRGTSSCSTANTATTPITVTPSTLPGATSILPGATAFPSTTLYFAEGYTGRFATNGKADFDEYISVLNPDNFAKTVTFTYQIQGSSTPIVTTTTVGPNSDILESVNGDVGNDKIVSAIVSSPNRVAAERVINRTTQPSGSNANGRLDSDSSLGNTSPGTTWYFAEGYTGATFQEYLTIQNPFSTTATVSVTVLPQSQPATTSVVIPLTVPGNSRITENIRRDYLPSVLAGMGQSIGLKVTSDQPIVAERVMYWGDGNGSAKYGASSKAGATGAGKNFIFAYGSAPGTTAANATNPAQVGSDESFVTVINPSPASLSDAVVLVSFFAADGTPLGSKSITVSPQTRETIAVNSVINAGAPVAGNYYTTVSSDQPIFVEKPQYLGGSPNSGMHPGVSPSGTVGGVQSVLFPNVNTGTASGTPIVETVFIVNPTAAPITVNGTYYTPGGATVTKSYAIASNQSVVVNVNADAGGLPVGPLGAQFTSTGIFDAARISNSPDQRSYIGNQGVVNQ